MKYKLSEIALFNPTEPLKKGTLAKKVGMDKLKSFCRDIPDYEIAEFSGGMKFRNGDTIIVRDIAIKSMVGSSGRQRVQTDVVKGIEVELPTLDEQRKIGSLLKILDDKIAVKNNINENLAA